MCKIRCGFLIFPSQLMGRLKSSRLCPTDMYSGDILPVNRDGGGGHFTFTNKRMCGTHEIQIATNCIVLWMPLKISFFLGWSVCLQNLLPFVTLQGSFYHFFFLSTTNSPLLISTPCCSSVLFHFLPRAVPLFFLPYYSSLLCSFC